jgi:hypothetical protein
MIAGRLLSTFVLCAGVVTAQQYVISTVAGGSPLPTPIAATSVPLAARGGTMFASRDRKRIKKQPSQSRYNAFLMGA